MKRAGKPGPKEIRGEGEKRKAFDARFAEAIRASATRKDACAIVGISVDTFGRYMKEYPDFAEMVERVELEVKAEMIAVVRKAAVEGNVVVTVRRRKIAGVVVAEEETVRKEKDVGAAKWWLSRRYPEEWGDRLALSGPDGGAIQIQFADQLDRIYGKGGSGGG